jgi:hypothetical protein
MKEGSLFPTEDEGLSVGFSAASDSVDPSVALSVTLSVTFDVSSGISVGFRVLLAATAAAIITTSESVSAKSVNAYERLKFLLFSFCQKLGLLLKDEGIFLSPLCYLLPLFLT